MRELTGSVHLLRGVILILPVLRSRHLQGENAVLLYIGWYGKKNACQRKKKNKSKRRRFQKFQQFFLNTPTFTRLETLMYFYWSISSQSLHKLPPSTEPVAHYAEFKNSYKI